MNPLDKAVVEVDEETLAFMENQRRLKGKGTINEEPIPIQTEKSIGNMDCDVQKGVGTSSNTHAGKFTEIFPGPHGLSSGDMEVEFDKNAAVHSGSLETGSQPFDKSSQ